MDLYDENIARLIRHSLTGELSERERVELEVWLRDSEEHQVLFEKIKKEMKICRLGTDVCGSRRLFFWNKIVIFHYISLFIKSNINGL